MTNQRCWVIVGDPLCWPNNIRVQVYFGSTAVAAIWDYSAESPVWKQVSGQQGDFRGAVFRTGRRDGPAGRRKPRTGDVKWLAQVLLIRCHNEFVCVIIRSFQFRGNCEDISFLKCIKQVLLTLGLNWNWHQDNWVTWERNMKGSGWVIVMPGFYSSKQHQFWLHAQ